MPVEACSENSPLSSVGRPQQYSITSSPRATSPIASEKTLPCSSGEEPRDVVAVLVEERADAEEELGAARERERPPRGEGRLRGLRRRRRPPRPSRSRPRRSGARSPGCRPGRCGPTRRRTALPPIQWVIRLTACGSSTGGLASSVIAPPRRDGGSLAGARSVSAGRDPIVERIEREAGIPRRSRRCRWRGSRRRPRGSRCSSVTRRRVAGLERGGTSVRRWRATGSRSDAGRRGSIPRRLAKGSSARLRAPAVGFERRELSRSRRADERGGRRRVPQDWVVATARGGEVVSDSTNVLRARVRAAAPARPPRRGAYLRRRTDCCARSPSSRRSRSTSGCSRSSRRPTPGRSDSLLDEQLGFHLGLLGPFGETAVDREPRKQASTGRDLRRVGRGTRARARAASSTGRSACSGDRKERLAGRAGSVSTFCVRSASRRRSAWPRPRRSSARTRSASRQAVRPPLVVGAGRDRAAAGRRRRGRAGSGTTTATATSTSRRSSSTSRSATSTRRSSPRSRSRRTSSARSARRWRTRSAPSSPGCSPR